MSEEEVDRVYTIPLGKVLLSPHNQRSKRAINMIKEFARHHMKTEQIKIDQDVSHQVWARGIRHPPRKIRVRMSKDEDGNILVSKYEEDLKEKEKEKEKTKSKEKTQPTKPEPSKVEPVKEKEEIKEKPKTEVTKKSEKTKEKKPEKKVESKPEKTKPKEKNIQTESTPKPAEKETKTDSKKKTKN